jgi:hypothetical protein
MGKSYTDVLTICSRFLTKHPSEAIFMSVIRNAQTFRNSESPTYHVHDRYRGLADEDKYELVVAHIEEAKHGDPKDLYITFSSAVNLRAHGYAETINPRLNDYLAKSPKGRVGIIAMDYFEEPRELVSNVIKMN